MSCPASTVLVLAGTTAQGWPYGDQIPFTMPVTGAIRLRWSAVPAVPGLTWRLLDSAGNVIAETPATLPPSGLTSAFSIPAGSYTFWLTTAAVAGVGANSHTVNQTVTYAITGACAGPPPPPPNCPKCSSSQYCNAATGYKCVACSPACAAGGVCGPSANACTCPAGKCCPPCAALETCSGDACHCLAPALGVGGVCTCPAPNTVVNGRCTVPGSPPPPPPGSSEVLPAVLAVAGVIGGIWILNEESKKRSGQPRRRDHWAARRRH